MITLNQYWNHYHIQSKNVKKNFKIETWRVETLYEYLWGGSKDYTTFKSNLQLLRDSVVFVSLPFMEFHLEIYYVVALDGETVIGLLQYCVGEQWHLFESIGVNHQYLHKGVSKALIQHWAKTTYKPEKGELKVTSFTNEGWAWVKPQLEALNIPLQTLKKLPDAV